MAIRVLLVDDSALMREGLKALLGSTSGIEVVAEAEDAGEAIARAAAKKPDVVLMDVSLHIIDAVHAARAIREQHPQVGIILLSRHSGDQPLSRPLHCCADLLLAKKHTGRKQLIEAIHAAAAGKSSADASSGVARLAPMAWPGLSAWERLSSREREVFKLVVEGKSSSEIAEIVKLSPKTVQTYRARVMSKLKVRNFPGLMKFALQYGVTSFG